MKTIEEKAKAYDEIIERANTMLAAGEVMYGKENNASQLITDIIPELRESEDERMCKRAIAILKKQRDYWSYDGPMDKFPPATQRKDLVDALDVALSYLEKQEQKPAWSEEDEKNLELVTDCVCEFYPDPVMKYKLKDWLKSLRPQPHWKPSRAQMSMLLAVINEPNNASSESCHLALAELYGELKKL